MWDVHRFRADRVYLVERFLRLSEFPWYNIRPFPEIRIKMADARAPPCEQSLFYLFPSYTEKIGSAQI